jgi:DNA-binding transcriptional ArsR family regulator
MIATRRALDALAALAHEHRLAAFRALLRAGDRGLAAGRIAARLAVPPSSLTFHLQHLERAGLVVSAREGRQVIYRVDLAAMQGLVAYLTAHCCEDGSGAETCRSAA